MNLNQLWSGNDYVYYDMRGRGEAYRSNGVRVRIMRAYQKRQYGNERMSGLAEVQFLNDDGTPRLTHDSKPRTGEIRARDIAMRWDEYVDERNHREAEREKLQKEREEAAAKEAAARTALLEALVEEYGIPRDAISSIDSYQIRIYRKPMEEALGARRASA